MLHPKRRSSKHFSALKYVAVCSSVVLCVAVCCGVLQCVAACRSVLQRVLM